MAPICQVVEQYLPGFVKVVEWSPEFIKLLLCDTLAISGQDLVLNLVDGSEIKKKSAQNIMVNSILAAILKDKVTFSPNLIKKKRSIPAWATFGDTWLIKTLLFWLRIDYLLF